MNNILFVLTDQMRYDAIHAHGNSMVKTPVLDKLAEHGVSFTRAYTPCPVCVYITIGKSTEELHAAFAG